MAIKHLKVSGKGAPADPSKVGGPDWDEAHIDDTFLGGGNFDVMQTNNPDDFEDMFFHVLDVGFPGIGSQWRSDGNYWNPVVATMIGGNIYGNPINGVAQSAEQVLQALPLKSGMFVTGRIFRLLLSVGKDGTNDSLALRIRMGVNGDLTDALVCDLGSVLSSGDRSVGFELHFRMDDGETVLKLGSADGSFSGKPSASLLYNAATLNDDISAQDAFLSICVAMSGSTDAPSLGHIYLELMEALS